MFLGIILPTLYPLFHFVHVICFENLDILKKISWWKTIAEQLGLSNVNNQFYM